MAKHSDTSKAAANARRARERNKMRARVLSFVVAVALAFVAGFLVRGQTALLTSLGFFFTGSEDATSTVSAQTKSTFNAVSSRLAEVEDVLSANSMDGYDLDSATSKTLEALAEATGDEYLCYFDAEHYASYVAESSDADYAGIGVLFADYNGRTYVADVFEGSVAEAHGVQQGDIVVSIDGDSSHDWSLTETVKALDRNDGDRVVITWMRTSSLDAETGDEFTTTLTCSKYSATNVTSELSETVGYIKLRQITQNSADLVSSAITDLTEQGATSFVLDLRDNPGGYLTQAVDIASLFVKSGVLVEVQTLDGSSTKTATGDVVTTAPLVVIVNDYTAAAAEVLAAALQDNQRAEIIGTTTMGKGSVQVVRELSFGGALRYTAAYYKTPLGHDINGVGIIPDRSVGATSDETTDAQKSLALETALELSAA